MASLSGALQIFNVSSPWAPEALAPLDLGSDVTAVAAGPPGYLVVGLSEGGIRVIDISDPSTPASVGSLEGGDIIRDIVVEGDLAVVGSDAPAADTGSALFVSLADPTSPELLGTHEMSDRVYGVEYVGGVAYIVSFSEIAAVDVATDALLWTLSSESGANLKADVSGDRLYVARNDKGLAIYSLSDPTAPALLAEHPVDGYMRNVRVEGNVAYLASKSLLSGVPFRVWDVTSATEPVELAAYAHPGKSSEGLAVADGYAYLGLIPSLVILDANCPQPLTCDAGGQCAP